MSDYQTIYAALSRADLRRSRQWSRWHRVNRALAASAWQQQLRRVTKAGFI